MGECCSGGAVYTLNFAVLSICLTFSSHDTPPCRAYSLVCFEIWVARVLCFLPVYCYMGDNFWFNAEFDCQNVFIVLFVQLNTSGLEI